MKKLRAEVAIIGAGTAGLVAYSSARRQAENVILIEGGQYGTTCARVGCMPSKLMIAAADAAHSITEATGFGIDTKGKLRIDGVKVMKRIRDERDRFVGFVLESVKRIKPEHRLRGYAHFLDNNTLRVGDHTVVEAKAIIIATGSSPSILPMFRELGDRLIVSDDVFEWHDLPSSIAVFGAGIIGLELGQAFHRLGIKTVILGKGGFIGPLNDPVIRRYAAKIFAEEFYIDPDAEVTELRREGDHVLVRFLGPEGKEREERVEYALAATGRVPNVQNLGLERTTLTLDAEGVPLFDRFTSMCGDSSIFIAGDADNHLPFLHEAADEGRIAGENAAKFPDVCAGNRRGHLSIVFTDPQISIVGLSYNKLKDCSFVTGEVSFEDQSRSRVILKNKGLMHVYAEYGTGLFLGTEMFCPRAEHLGHLLAWAFQKKMAIPEMLEMPFYHPVIEEGLRTALKDANNKLCKGPPVRKHDIDWGPGA